MTSAVWRDAERKGHIRNAILAEIDHPDDPGFFWDGEGKLEDGDTVYEGAGILGRIETVTDSLEPEIVETRFTVSGIDAELVAGLTKSIKGRKAHVYEALLDEHYRVVEKDLLVEASLDYQVFSFDDDGTASITIVSHGGLFFLRNRSSAKWSPEEAKQRFPDESGFDEVHLVESQVDDWRPA